MAYTHAPLSDPHAAQPVAITKVDLDTRRAEALTRRRSTIVIDLRHHVGGMQVTPAVGEQWFVNRADSFYYRLSSKIPHNAPEMLTEAAEGQVQVGSTGPLELNGQRVNVNAEILSLGGLELRNHDGELQRNTGTPEDPEWEPIGSGAGPSDPVATSTDELPEGEENLYFTAERAAAAAPVQSVAGRTGDVVLTKADVGLSQVDNTSDAERNAAPATLTNKTISGTNNTVTNIALASVRGLPLELPGGGVVIGGDFQDDALWANAWGEQISHEALPGRTRSHELTATGAGENGDVLVLTHDGTGNPVFVPVMGPRTLTWRIVIGKGFDNVGGGNIRLQTRFEDFDGVISTATTNLAADDIEYGVWDLWTFYHYTVNWRRAYQCRLILDDDIPVGDTFQIAAISIHDSGDSVDLNTPQTVWGKTLVSPVISSGNAPATSTSPGVAGQVEWDANYVYVCVATNQWKRSALSSW